MLALLGIQWLSLGSVLLHLLLQVGGLTLQLQNAALQVDTLLGQVVGSQLLLSHLVPFIIGRGDLAPGRMQGFIQAEDGMCILGCKLRPQV